MKVITDVFDKCVLLFALALIFAMFAVLAYRPEPIVYTGFSSRDMYVELPKNIYEHVEPEPVDVYANLRELHREMTQVPVTITYQDLVLYDSYTVFITAYCAEECGWNYSTSSDTICHRSSEDNRYEPTTCAVDLHYFPYGTLFYVPSEDRVYVAEDTGAFRGMWIDLYQDDMSDVISYPTRYETVYICDFVECKETFYPPRDMHDKMNKYLLPELS